jgi:hypothetical protein
MYIFQLLYVFEYLTMNLFIKFLPEIIRKNLLKFLTVKINFHVFASKSSLFHNVQKIFKKIEAVLNPGSNENNKDQNKKKIEEL